jgi:hypothetical protein
MTDFREHRANGAVATARYRLHVLDGWLRQSTILCLCQERLPRVVGDEMDREE